MARKAKPYLKNGWYVTSIGGLQHQKLCKQSEGLKTAEVALARLQVLKSDPTSVLASSASVNQVLKDFLDFKKVNSSTATYDYYVQKLAPFHKMFSSRPITSITHRDGTNYKDYLMHHHKWKRGKKTISGLKQGTVNHHIRTVRTLFNWASTPTKRGLYGVSINPWTEIKYFQEYSRERIITDDELLALLDNCLDGAVRGGKLDYQETLIVQRYTTMRPQEMRKLRWDYVDFTLHRLVFPGGESKNRKRREITMINRVEQILRTRRDRAISKGLSLAGKLVFAKPVKINGKQVACEAGDKMYSGSAFADKFRRVLKRCVEAGSIQMEKSGERLVPYSTRHTRITELFCQKNDQATVMFDAGHSDPSMTERYKHLSASYVASNIRQNDQAPTIVLENEGSSSPVRASSGHVCDDLASHLMLGG